MNIKSTITLISVIAFSPAWAVSDTKETHTHGGKVTMAGDTHANRVISDEEEKEITKKHTHGGKVTMPGQSHGN